jgi:D-arabinose 1-dehydrogenase-like Zn-dependent alcohol dehydrogenase
MSRSTSNRRNFLRSAAALTAAGVAAPYWFSGEDALAEPAKSKNDRPLVGVIGVGGQGTYIAEQAAHFGDIVAVCDVSAAKRRSIRTTASCSTTRASKW